MPPTIKSSGQHTLASGNVITWKREDAGARDLVTVAFARCPTDADGEETNDFYEAMFRRGNTLVTAQSVEGAPTVAAQRVRVLTDQFFGRKESAN